MTKKFKMMRGMRLWNRRRSTKPGVGMDAGDPHERGAPTLAARMIEQRRLPIATVFALVITSAVTILQFAHPEVLGALRRDPAALSSGEWWRTVTPLLVHADGWP